MAIAIKECHCLKCTRPVKAVVKAGMWEDSLEAMSHGPFSSSWEADQQESYSGES